MESFTHLDAEGKAIMVDVSQKPETKRVANATGSIHVSEQVLSMLGDHTIPKGDVLATARLAGIMAAKQTAHLIPLCHPLSLTSVSLDFSVNKEDATIQVYCKVETVGKTGVEMEALTGVSVALLTIYDMCKSLDRGMKIGNIHLIFKSGGKSGFYEA